MAVVCKKSLIARLLCAARMHTVMLDRMLLNVCVLQDTLEIRIFSVMVRIIRKMLNYLLTELKSF